MSGVQATSVRCSAGTTSAHTGCQIPVVRSYQIPRGLLPPVLLAARLVGVDRVVLRAYDEHVLRAARVQHVGDVGGERRLTALVRGDELPVDQTLRAVVDSAEVDQDALALGPAGDELVPS